VKKLSSSVFFLKRVFPLIWCGFLAFFAATVVITRSEGPDVPWPVLFMPLAMLVFGYVLMKKLVWDLADEVTDEGDHLLVRFGDRQERIALSNIINVGYTVLVNPPRVTLTLRVPCRFGREVSFCPPRRRYALFSKNPIITELIERIDLARRASAR
jgi:hypothetical protein